MLIVVLVLASLQLVLAYLCFQICGRNRRAMAFALFCIGTLVATGLLMNVSLFVNGLLLALIGPLLSMSNASHRAFARIATLGTASVLFVTIASFVPTMRERMKLREEYPFESLSARLSHLKRPASRVRAEPTADEDSTSLPESTGAVAAAFETKLTELEDSLGRYDHPWRYDSRAEALKQIHSGTVQQFIDAPGFGVGRRIGMKEPEKYAKVDERRPAPQPVGVVIDLDATQPDDSTAAARPGPGPAASVGPPSTNQLQVMYELSLLDFINHRGWGYVRDINHVSGFQSHRFRQLPLLPPRDDNREVRGFRGWNHFSDEPDWNEGLDKTDENWHIRRLELVSLLRHDEPCVYVSDELPRMDAIAEFAVRPIGPFERRSLKMLQGGVDIATEAATNQLQMMGAIRAAKQCLKCHQVERGELLGAFSYILQRDPPVRLKNEPVKPML